MKEIKIEIGQEAFTYRCPEGWGEVTQRQWVAVVGQLLTYGELTPLGVKAVLGIKNSESVRLMPIDWHVLGAELEWMKELDGVTSWMVEEVELPDGRKCYPPAANFDDMTWEEFMFVDVSASRKAWDVVAACLYRPLKEAATEEEDERIAFSRFGVSARLPMFKGLSPLLLSAIEINYMLLRKRITDLYPNIFRGGSRKVKRQPRAAAGDGDTQQPSAAAGTDWVGVYRRLLGEHVWEEERLLKLPVNTVLFRLDVMVKDGKEREKEMRRARRRR